GDELELVAHGPKLPLEACNRCVVQGFFPVEGWRAVVGQHLVRILCQHAFGKLSCFLQIRLRGFTPDQVGVWRVRDTPRDCGFYATTDVEEAFCRALAGDEFPIA